MPTAIRRAAPLAFVVLTITACSRLHSDPPCARASEDPDVTPGAAVVPVTGPTLIAYFAPVEQRDLDSSQDLNEVLGDFGADMYDQGPRFERAGVRTYWCFSRDVYTRDGARVRRFSRAPADIVGYYLIRPGREPAVFRGVGLSGYRLDSAAAYFGLPELRSPPDTAPPDTTSP